MDNEGKDEEYLSGPRKMHNLMNVFGSLKLDDKIRGNIGQGDTIGQKRYQGSTQIVSLSPSEYMRQLSMTTEERLELLTRDVRPARSQETSNHRNEFHDFDIVPHMLLFQRYTSGNIYNVTLTIRNTGKVSRYLKLTCEKDPIFTIEYKGIAASLNTRLAPGMFTTYNVRFSPEENRDYEYAIKFTTDREIIVIPVIALGPRPILDFPDHVTVPETAVKIATSKSLLVRNLGDSVAVFSLFNSSPYFWLEPSKGVIEEEETVQFVVNFLSNKTGFFEDNLFLRYETGEIVRIKVQGSTIDCNVRLERGSVRMPNETYIGLSTSKILKIFNRSEYIVKYRWMRYKDDESDRAQKEKYKRIFETINNSEVARSMDLVHYNICTPQAHELVCQRIYADEIASLVEENFPYNNSKFTIVPMEGEIWPQSSTDVTVHFEPDEIGEITSMAYLEVTGREERICLSLSGVSIGPLIKLNVSTMDVQNIFLCSVHNYEVICANKGLIPGVLVHRPKRSDFGGIIEVTPNQLKLQPDQYKSFNVSFSSNKNGNFVERVDFVVKESLQVLAMYIKGRVVCPTLHFDKSQLDFGTIALGFTSKQDVTLHNDSLVPVTFSITVPDDGNEAAITHEDFAKSPTSINFPSSSREFVLIRNEGIVEARTSLEIKIKLTPNSMRVGKTTLRVDMWDTDTVPVSLPIIFRSIVASMLVKPAEIDIRFCFVNVPYTRNFIVENTSEIEGYFYLVPQTISDSTTMLYSMSTNQGYLAPGQSKNVSLTVTTRAMGKQKCVLSMLSFGEKVPTACCTLTCNGQGPVVSVEPTTLDFTNVELLQEKTMAINLISDSPVSAEFTASMSSKNSSWTVSPISGDLSPGQTIELRATIFLRDVGKHSDKIIITIRNSRTIIVSLNAIGIGSCVDCDPPIFPIFHMGSLFSRQFTRIPIKLTNQGSRGLKLIFSNSTEIKILAGQLQAPICDKFSIEPFVIELPARGSKKVFCNARSDTCDIVSEQWWLHCYVEGQGKREIIGNSKFTATFVEPSIVFSKKELLFRLDVKDDKSLSSDEFFMINESVRTLNAHLSIDPPFGIINDHEDSVQNLKIVLLQHEKRRIRVLFSPKDGGHSGKRYSQNFVGYLSLEYDEHSNADKIKCLASVNFPNIAPLPREIRFNCPLACSVVENILLKNDGPLEVTYKFIWLEDSISVKRDLSCTNEAKLDKLTKPNDEDKSENSDLLAKTKNFLMSIVNDGSLTEETEMSVLESLRNDPPIIDFINQICSIVPYEGTVPAYSSQCVTFGFHGIESMNLEAKVLCKIEGGPTEFIRIFGTADFVKFQMDKDRVDFGQQMICEQSRATIKLQNLSKINLVYHIELSEDPSNKCLDIRPMSATIPGQSEFKIELISRPIVPGNYEKSFLLCVQYNMPRSIVVQGNASISQVYVCLPRKYIFNEHPVELGYRAIQSLANSFDHYYEYDNGWEIVANDNTLPGIMDIEMAIERSLARDFLLETRVFKDNRNIATKDDYAIPYLFSPEYVLDMGYVIVGETSNVSTRVYNYGSRSVRVRLKKPDKMDNLAKQGIDVYFRDQTPLMPGEFIDIQVSFNPPKLKASEKSSAIKRKFYLEVTNGFTLPIIIEATVTCPFVTVHPKILNFRDVSIGECMLTHLLMKNEGLIDSPWEAKLPPTRRNQSDGPFYLRNSSDFYSSGQSGTIQIYFQPRKSGYVESQLTIITNNRHEPTIVLLRGRGIEKKLKISQSSIDFNRVLPFTKSDGKIFKIENLGQRPVELYWQHLDELVHQEERLIRVLTHYYQVQEILLPIRRPPETLPRRLFDFYDYLVDEMSLNAATQHRNAKHSRENDEIAEFPDYTDDEGKIAMIEDSTIRGLSRKSRGKKKRKISRKLTRTRSSTVVSSEANLSIAESNELEIFQENILPDDPEEIENLLHCYIDELQKNLDFRETMKDPVKEVFDAIENKMESKIDQDDLFSLTRKKKICVIFHGSPFTEYQQVACKTSRILDLPLLNLDNAITEMIALGNTACSAKLRETIDSKYQNLLSISAKFDDNENKILSNDELNVLDSLSRYEYKIETIVDNLEKNVNVSISRDTPRGRKVSTRDDDKASRTSRVKVEETFLDIDIQLIVELLDQRLSMEDLSQGFVLQTLKNHFITNETKSLSSLLQIIGEVEYPIFVTFDKSLVSYEMENFVTSNDRAQSLDDIAKKLEEIDEMSLAEFDILSDSDKQLYREKIINVRSQNALERFVQFQQNLSDLRKMKKLKNRGIASQSDDKSLKNLTKSKSRTKSQQPSEKFLIQELSSKRKSKKNEDSKNSARKTIPEDVQINVDVYDAYSSSLKSILTILQNWDPARKIILTQKENETPKNSKHSKSKERSQTATEKSTEANDRFWIWHVKINDSLNSKIYDTIVNEMAKNKEILNTTTEQLSVENEPKLFSQLYSVAMPKNLSPAKIKRTNSQEAAFGVVALRDESTEIDQSDSPDPREESLESRIILQPRESRTFKIYFSPKNCDLYEEEYSLGIVNSNDSFYTIRMRGYGDIPSLDMDPCRIFKKIKRLKKDDLNEPTFFEDTQTFDFGSLLLTGNDNKVHRKKTSFKFWNISKMDLKLDVSLMANDSKSFNVEPKQLFIKPDEFGTIDVTAGVTKLGVNEDRLVLLVKDNPRVEVIELRSKGAKLEVELDEKNISFGRVLLYREITKNLKIRNDSTIPIFWRITPAVSIDSQLKFEPSMGWTRARSESQVVFTFLSNRIGTMEEITMNFGVFLNDMDNLEEKLFTETITVTGETYDVAVDVNLANPIDLGNVRVGSIANVSFNIKNRGQYEVKFVIEFEKSDKLATEIERDLRKNLREDLEISPLTGSLLPDKITTINMEIFLAIHNSDLSQCCPDSNIYTDVMVNFHPKFEMNLREIPLVRCNLIDANNGATIVAEFPLTISITAHYARFRVIPDTEMSFGPMGICDNKTLHLNVENIGYFPIKYQIKSALLLAMNIEDSSGKWKKEKSPRTESKNKKGTSKHETVSNLRLGPFTLSDIEGNIEPGVTKTLTIDCYPETEGNLEEKILVCVDDCRPEDKSGKILILKVHSCLPSIDFHDIDAIFPESYLVDDIQDFQCPKEIDAHTIFSRIDKCLYFERVNIHKPHTTSIKLHNRGLVAAKVTVSLRPDVLTPKNAKPDTFALDTVQEYVLPMSSRIFSMSFTPCLIETYTGVLEASVELPNHVNQDFNKFTIKLSGEGCVPEVTIIEPMSEKNAAGKYCINFGRCLVDETNTRNLCFKNIGRISAKIIIGIYHDTELLYGLRKFEKFSNSIEVSNDYDETWEEEQSSVICTLRPDELAKLHVDFRPKVIGKQKAEINFHVLDNPYENVTLEIKGEGFVENIVIEDLQLVEVSRTSDGGGNRTRKFVKNRGSASVSRGGSSITLASQSFASMALVYNLDYGTCFVNKINKINFKIINKSRERYFRFEFSSYPNVVFVPSIGHIQCLGRKDIEANFFTSEPITHKETTLECAISEIRFPNDHEETNFWDDRQTTVQWIQVVNDDNDTTENLGENIEKKIVVPTREPSHEILPENCRTIYLIFSAIAAYTEFSCVVREIHFKETLMFQNREYTFVMENPGNVDLVFNWKIDMDAGYPTRLPENSILTRNLKPRSTRSTDSRPSSRSSGGILYPQAEKPSFHELYSRHQRGDELLSTDADSSNYCKPILSRDKSRIIDVEPYDCSCNVTSDLFSDSFARTQRSIESWTEYGDEQPFSIKPNIGVIPAGKNVQFNLRFSPLDVFDYKAYLACQIENLSPNLEAPNILVTGRSLLPYCHFDIEESDYLTSGRRDSNLLLPQPGGGDTNEFTDEFNNPRVVEFHAIGTGDSHFREFYLINPTTENYRFIWMDMTSRANDELPYFHCAREDDVAESGKRTKIVFSFFAEEIGTFESFWSFTIERYELRTIFLLVASVTEPSVHFAETRLKMRPTVVGDKVEDLLTIVNDESVEFSWKILSDTLHSEEGAFQNLVVTPMSGILGPNAKQILQLSLLPSRVGDFTFSLQCQLKRMKNPLVILVTARVSQIIPRVLYSNDNFVTKRIFEAHYDRENILDFGKLTLNKPATIKFDIANMSDVMFRYTWDLGMNDPRYLSQSRGSWFLTISKESESVSSISESTCNLELTALRKVIIRQHPVTLKIERGPVYRMFVKASSKNPSIDFNFVNYDFGPCYVRDENSPASVAQLLITNNDKTPAIVECTFENLPHMTINLEPISRAIPGNSTVTIVINFRPTEPSDYHENLTFRINDSTIRQIVSIKGEGILHKICLENVRDKFIELGNVPIGKVVTRKIRVLNSARAPVAILFDLIKKLPAYDVNRKQQNFCTEETMFRSKFTKQHSSSFHESRGTVFTSVEENNLALDTLSILPSNYVNLGSGKCTEIIVKFLPTKRISSFIEKIGGQADSTILPLFFVRGSCVAREFCLDRSHLYFGTIVEGCNNVTKLVLRNIGDFGARFRWNVSKLLPHFDLEPVSGYCSPGMDVTFSVTFRPKELSLMLEAEASIDIEKHPSLKITCSGACCKIPNSIDVLRFAIPVRSVQTKNLTITNDTSVDWNVETALNGEYFQAEEQFIVTAKKSYSCELIYSPMVMNTEKNPHEGRLIVKLPEDKPPLVYTLLGLSLPPEVEGKIVRQLPAKTKYVELLPVNNWSNKPQSFTCEIKQIDDLKVQYSFTGNTRLDVPANGTRDYRALFYCYKETTLNFRITFTNDVGEYEFYELQYKVTKPDTLSTIKLTSPARSTVCYHLEIENPLNDRDVTFNANCQHRDITIRNVPKIVTAKSNDKIIIEYSPLITGESVAKLDVNCSELGNFPYELKLKATAAPFEKVIRVSAMLGKSTNFPIVINNISKKNVEFSIKIDDPSFTCNRSITVPAQRENILEVNYEPCEAKNVRAILRATSEYLGEICFPLIGSYTLPKPQGPFTIARNSTISIEFKNVSQITKTFAYVIDGANEFSLATSSNVIKTKGIATITVRFSSPNDSSKGEREYPLTGKLVVSCIEPTNSQIVWVYYLRGIKE